MAPTLTLFAAPRGGEALVEIPNRQGDMKPVVWVRVAKSVFVHRSPGGYCHRVGSSKRQMSPELLPDHTELKLTIYAISREKNGLLAQFSDE